MTTPQDQHPEFSYTLSKDKLFISYRGRCVMILSGSKAQAAQTRLVVADPADIQLILAKLTGNFKRGNERPAQS